MSLHDSGLGGAVALTIVRNKVIAIISCDSCQLSRRVGRLRWPGVVDVGPARNVSHGTIDALKVPFQAGCEEILVTARLDRSPNKDGSFMEVCAASTLAMSIAGMFFRDFRHSRAPLL